MRGVPPRSSHRGRSAGLAQPDVLAEHSEVRLLALVAGHGPLDEVPVGGRVVGFGGFGLAGKGTQDSRHTCRIRIMRSAVVSVALVGLIFVGSACQPEEESADVVSQADPGRVSETISAVNVSANPEHVASCVEQAKYGAYIGDPIWTQFWNDAGQTDAGATGACEWLGAADPVQLQTIHEGWGQVQAFLAAAEQAPPPQADPQQPAAPPRYGTCKEAIAADGGNYRAGIDPQYDYYDDRDGDGVVCDN